MDAHEQRRPCSYAEGAPFTIRSYEETASRIVGPSAPFVNGCLRPNRRRWGTNRRSSRLYGLSVFAVIAGAASYLLVHVLAASWGWQGAAVAMTGTEWLTLCAAAAGVFGDRR